MHREISKTRENVEIRGHHVCVPSGTGTNVNTVDPPPTTTTTNAVTIVITEVAINHRDVRKSRRAPRHRGGLADLLAKGETPRRDTRRTAPRNLDILRSNSQNRYRACVLVLRLSLFLPSHSRRGKIKLATDASLPFHYHVPRIRVQR